MFDLLTRLFMPDAPDPGYVAELEARNSLLSDQLAARDQDLADYEAVNRCLTDQLADAQQRPASWDSPPTEADYEGLQTHCEQQQNQIATLWAANASLQRQTIRLQAAVTTAEQQQSALQELCAQQRATITQLTAQPPAPPSPDPTPSPDPRIAQLEQQLTDMAVQHKNELDLTALALRWPTTDTPAGVRPSNAPAGAPCPTPDCPPGTIMIPSNHTVKRPELK